MAQTENKQRSLVIIGNGMVSHRLCQNLAAEEHDFSIAVFGEEIRPAYDRVNLTKFFETNDPDSLLLGSHGWYAERGIDLRVGERIVAIHRGRKLLETEKGEYFAYDQLVIATGSKPFVPPMAGVDLEGVFVYRTIEDLIAIQSYSRKSRTAAVIGGGLLGLEAAKALHDLGVKTHIVEFAQGLMPRQLNKEGSLVLESKVRELGVDIHLSKQTQSITRVDGALRLEYVEGEPLTVDMIVISAGIRPRDELAEVAGLRRGVRGGIIVDDSLKTEDASIYAIGECALHRGMIYGLVAPGYMMAEVLASSLLGRPSLFEGADLSSRLKLLGVELSTFGDYLGEGQHITYKATGVYRDIVLSGSELVGATSIGEWDQAGLLQVAIAEQKWISPHEQKRFEDAGELELLPGNEGPHSWPPQAIICNCCGVTRGALSELILEGYSSIEALSKKTGASTVCGSCRPLLAEMVGVSAGAPEATYRPKGRTGLLVSGILAFVIGLIILFANPIPAPDSVQTIHYEISKIWTDGFWKKVTGFSLVGLSVLALLLPLRKRIKRFNFLQFGIWRMLHAVLGVLCLLFLVAHTGLSLGDNLNFALMVCFLGLNIVGALAGGYVAMEDRLSGPRSRFLRRLVTRAHILFFWPFPVLLGFHVFKVFLY